MKNITRLLLFFVAVMFATTAMSQSTVTGTVLDSETNTPLPAVNIIEKGTAHGVSSDFDGGFTLTTLATETTIVISYVGFLTKEIVVTQDVNLGDIALEADNALEEIIITATSFAVDRKTPVAVSTIKAADIEFKLGTQEFPEILKSTPGVYATKQGGGYGDGRINLRGFTSENVAVMINGVPVNDMETGAVYWSNWAGLGDVTSAMQVQRGLGASKVAVPSIGGTVNIISKSYDAEKGGSFRIATGNDGYQKYGMSLSTGLMENGLAITASGAKILGNGYVDGTEFSGFNYFLNVTKIINDNHKLSFTGFGAKQEHGQRYNTLTIAENRATEAGGKRFNRDWGYKNGEVENISYNFYHKPQLSLNHYWTINEKTNLSTAVYASFGSGGGGRSKGDKFLDDDYRIGDFDTPINFDKIVAENKANGANGSTDILGSSRNSHNWYGILSTLKTDLSDELVLSGGLDARYYKGSHWYQVDDLLGGQFYLNDDDSDNTYLQPLKVGDKYNRDYDGKVIRTGVFAQAEYSANDLSVFVSSAVSNDQYSKEAFMNYAPNDPDRKSDKINFIGYSIKGGANYNLNESHNVFANVGYFSKAPFLTQNVFISKNSTEANPDAINEKVFSAEVGYGFRSSVFSANVNVYRTSWLDKSLAKNIPDPINQGERIEYNVPGLDALHQGIEVDFKYRMTDDITVTGMASLGDWAWQNDASTDIYDDAGNFIETKEVFIKDLKVSDAAQTTFALGVNYKLLPKTRISLDYNYAGNIYSKYDITTRDDETSVKHRQDSWEMPEYSLFDLSFNHGFKIGSFDTSITANMNNIFNVEYISDAFEGDSGTYTDAKVYYGTGRTFSLGMKIEF